MLSTLPWWAKAGGVAVIANEIRGAFVFAAGITDLHAHGPNLGQLWLLPLVILPPVLLALWKRHKVRARIARRLTSASR
jgi:hypothetical protein